MPMQPGAAPRIPSLDGLRGLAALQVVVFHYYLMLPIDADWYRVLQRASAVVDGLSLFFVLSGFLIGGILLDTRGTPGAIRTFYAHRLWRIMPLYLLLLLSYGIVRGLDDHFRWGMLHYWMSEFPFWNYLVFTQNYRMATDHVIGAPWLAVTWSLAVEQQFYLLVPWVVCFVDRRALYLLGTACVLASPWFRVPDYLPQYLLMQRLDALAIGVMAAALIREPAARAWLHRRRGILRTGVVGALVVLAAGQIGGITQALFLNTTIVCLCYGALMCLLADEAPWPVIKPALRLLAPLGLISYCVYIFHVPVMYLFEFWLPTARILALPATLGLAVLSFKYLEGPLMRFGKRSRYQAAKPAMQPG